MDLEHEIQRRVDDEAVAFLERVGLDLMGAAQREAPLEEGTLRGSADVELTRREDGAEVTVSFNTPYAAKQHEELGYKHPLGGKAKYLSDPLKARLPRYQDGLAAAMRRATGGG